MINRTIRQVMRGMITWKVEKDGLIVKKSSPYSNMILNQGLDFVADYSFADCFNYCAVGTGSTAPVNADTGLLSEVRRTNNLAQTIETNGTTLSTNIYTMFRTFIFEPVLVSHTFGEVGFSPLSVAGNNLFSKALIKDSSGTPVLVTINPGETLTIKYELSLEIYDDIKSIGSGIVGVGGSSGVLKIQKIGLKAVSATGTTIDFDDTGACNEPSVQANIFISNSSAPPELFNQCIDRSPGYEKMGGLSNYVVSDYRRKKGVLFKPSEYAGPFRSVGVGQLDSHGAVFVFNNEQTPGSNQAYLINFTYIWIFQNPSTFHVWLDSEDAAYLHPRVQKVNSYAYFAL